MNNYTCKLRLSPEQYREVQVILRRSQVPLSILFRGDWFLITRTVSGNNRRKAVRLALNWFWATFGGALGQACGVLTVDDPLGEVVYHAAFNCADTLHRYLPDDVAERVLAESRGELYRETRKGTPHHPPGTLRRMKRRRRLPFRIGPNLYRDANGTYFCRVSRRAQQSKNGVLVRRRAVSLIRLPGARNLKDALSQISERGLIEEHWSILARRPKKSLPSTWWTWVSRAARAAL